jgi:hypothetical protein
LNHKTSCQNGVDRLKACRMKEVATVLAMFSFACLGAAETGSSTSVTDHRSLFQQGGRELNISGGVLFSPFIATKNRPTIDYAIAAAQWGYMLTEPNLESRCCSGNFEIVGEVFGGGIFEGRGNYLGGGTLWLRYNFLPSFRLVPYTQIGAGALMTDVDRYVQSQSFNFNLDASFGARYFFNPSMALNLEYRLSHISNANLGSNNLGINAHGPMLGVSWFF